MKITSAPGGAAVFAGKRSSDGRRYCCKTSSLETWSYELRLPGYKPLPVTGSVKPGEQTFLGARFVQRSGPQRGEVWQNSLGMIFVPVGDVLMAIWTTRVEDYDAFCASTGRARLIPDFPQDLTHPVVKVNWQDATDFCEWLTRKEFNAGQLEEGQQYRLPTDAEWSKGAGLPDEGRDTPEQRDGKAPDFPWGKSVAAAQPHRQLRRYRHPPRGFPDDPRLPRRLPADVAGWFLRSERFRPRRHGRKRLAVVLRQLQGRRPLARLGSAARRIVVHGDPGGVADFLPERHRGERDVIIGFRCVLVPEAGQ